MKRVRRGDPSAPLRVLVVDDDRDCAESLAMLLQILRHQAEVVLDGRAALRAVRERQPDIVLLDIGLPELDGYDLARALRAGYPQLTIIAVTGWAREEDRAQALAAGCDYHVPKPVNLETLKRLLGQIAAGGAE